MNRLSIPAARAVVLATCALGILVSLWVVRKGKQPSPAPADDHAPVDSSKAADIGYRSLTSPTELEPLLDELARSLEPLDTAVKLNAWARLRALGPKAGGASNAVILAALASNDLAWLTAAERTDEPRVAATVALVEAGALAAPEPSSLWTSPDASSPSALGWRLDALGHAVLQSTEDKKAQRALRRRLGLTLEQALITLARPNAFGDLQAVRLAQSVFRSAPLVTDSRTEALVRRCAGRLLQTPMPEGSELMAHRIARLEAFAILVDTGLGGERARAHVARLGASLLPWPGTANAAELAQALRAVRLAHRVLSAPERP